MAAKKIKRNPSARKAARQAVRRGAANTARLSALRSAVKAVETALAAKDKKAAQAAFKNAQPLLMRGVQATVVSKNAASRKLSRLSARIKAI